MNSAISRIMLKKEMQMFTILGMCCVVNKEQLILIVQNTFIEYVNYQTCLTADIKIGLVENIC